MTFASKHNKATSRVFTFEQAEDAPWCKLKELFDHGYINEQKAFTVRGVYVNRGGKYGPQPAMICDGFNVNLPGHMLHDVEQILLDQADIDAINAGLVGGYAYEYTNRNGGKAYGMRWVDLAEMPF